MLPTRFLWLTVMLLMRGSVGEMAGEMEPFDSPPPPSQVLRYPSIGTQFFFKADDDAGSSSDGENPLPGNEWKNDPDERMSLPMRDQLFPSSGKRSGMEEAAVEELGGVNRRAFNPWGGRKRYFNPWGGKRFRGVERKVDPAFGKRPGFQPWGGKRNEKRAFNPWGGKRGPSDWSRDDRSKAFDEEREVKEKKRTLLRNP